VKYVKKTTEKNKITKMRKSVPQRYSAQFRDDPAKPLPTPRTDVEEMEDRLRVSDKRYTRGQTVPLRLVTRRHDSGI